MTDSEQRAPEHAWLVEAEAAAHLRYSADHLRHLRYNGTGPRHYRNPAGGVRYRLDDLDAWAEDRVEVEP